MGTEQAESHVVLLGDSIFVNATYIPGEAESLLAQFPSDVKFTSGRRNIADQVRARAPTIVKKRKWIEETYADRHRYCPLVWARGATTGGRTQG